MKSIYPIVLCSAVVLAGCQGGGANTIAEGVQLLAAGASLTEDSVVSNSKQAVAKMDEENTVADADNAYAVRLNKIVSGLGQYDGVTLNYKAYLSDQVNAFATPDGSIRVYAGLMDLMTDDQILAVIGHEIGHVKFKHSYNQMRVSYLSTVGQKVIAATGQIPAQLVGSQLGQMMTKFLNAQYSQSDELESDRFSVSFMRGQNKDPNNMIGAIKVLQEKFGTTGDFFSSHPSNPKRITNLEAEINK